MIILVGSQKGGAGKSTIATNIAAALAKRGNSVILVDADRQETSSDWAAYRDDTDAAKVVCVGKHGDIRETVKDFSEHYDYVVVDVAGRDSKELRYGMLIADLFISPVRPSQPDINTIPVMADMFEEALPLNPELVGYVVMNMCPTNPVISEANDAADYLYVLGTFNLAKTRLGDRKAYRDAYSEGLGVVEWKDNKAKQEIEKLLHEVL